MSEVLTVEEIAALSNETLLDLFRAEPTNQLVKGEVQVRRFRAFHERNRRG